MLVIKRADEDGDFQGIDAVGRKFEMSVSALRNLDYKRASAQEIASNFPALSLPKSELSARAWGVLHLVAEGVADICAFGMDPCDFRTIASTTSLSEAQLRTTLSALVRRGLLATWFREDDRASASAYVPTIAGIIALAEDAPTPEGVLATRRAANLMPAA
jgi:hypothetical protein